jgi:protein-S-isoprenylcysteine O-methyltransferase Ste14
MTTEESYLNDCLLQLKKLKAQADRAIVQTKDEDFFKSLDPEANSIAIIIKHLAGNMRSRWSDFITTDGEKSTRNRDAEFEMESEDSRERILALWEDGWSKVFLAISALLPVDLGRTITIRGEPHTVLEAINRQLTHYAGHTGQIVFLAKHFAGSNWKTLSIPRGQSKDFDVSKDGNEYKRPQRTQWGHHQRYDAQMNAMESIQTTGHKVSSRITIPRWLAIALGLLAWLVGFPLGHGALPWALASITTRFGWMGGHPALWNLAGFIPVAVGTVLFIWTFLTELRQVNRLPKKVPLALTPPFLVMRGPYRFTRNPMYIAEFALWLGWTILYGSGAVLIGFVVLWGLMVFVVVPREERTLSAHFSETYLHYKGEVPRWLGTTRLLRHEFINH